MKSKMTIIGLLSVLIFAVLVGAVLRHCFVPTIQVPAFHQKEQMVFAHRGGRSLGPENTLHTFKKALAYGAHALELDARLTRDGHLVVIHDATVDRTTEGTGAVGSLSLDDIGHLDAAFDYSPDGGRTFPLRSSGVTIPRLTEVFQRLPNIAITIELKDDSLAAAEALCRLMTEYGMNRKIIVASFHSNVIRHYRRICPDTPTAATAGEVLWFALLSRFRLENLYHPRAAALQVPEKAYGFRLVTPRFIKAAHRRGLKVHVWIVNHPRDKQKLFNMGVDGIMTDFPDMSAVRVKKTRGEVEVRNRFLQYHAIGLFKAASDKDLQQLNFTAPNPSHFPRETAGLLLLPPIFANHKRVKIADTVRLSAMIPIG